MSTRVVSYIILQLLPIFWTWKDAPMWVILESMLLLTPWFISNCEIGYLIRRLLFVMYHYLISLFLSLILLAARFWSPYTLEGSCWDCLGLMLQLHGWKRFCDGIKWKQGEAKYMVTKNVPLLMHTPIYLLSSIEHF